MRRSPFGPGAVVPGGRYLGAWIEAPAWGMSHAGSGWERCAYLRLATRTWTKALDTMVERSRTLTARPASPGIRASQWNTYCVSLALYPAQIAPPPAEVLNRMRGCVRDVFRTQG